MKALIVDDSKVVRTVSANILKELNIEFDEACDGVEAYDKVSQNEYDVIFLDWNMPNMDGYQFFEKASKEMVLGNAKVVFCTTESELDKITAAMELGAREYIMKPFDKEIIEDKLNLLGLI